MLVQIKDIKHIKQDFCSDTYVMPQGLGAAGCVGAQNLFIFEHGHVAYQIARNDFHPRVKLVTLG